MYQRILNLIPNLEKRSVFLFGPRATGKSTYLLEKFPDAKVFDLLNSNTFGRLIRDPTLIEQETANTNMVIVDEVQKAPIILDEIHRLISKRPHQRFILTGSSARKLKRGGANLLAGRARTCAFFPLVSPEIHDFNLIVYLNTGGLPSIYCEPEASLDLSSYVNTYLKEEIYAEGLTRNLQNFALLIEALALSNGEEINAQNFGSDLGISGRTVLNYIEILEDTLLAFLLPSFQFTEKRKPTSKPKFYFFDVGVTASLAKRGKIEFGSELFGKAFEHFLILETRAALSYLRCLEELSFWRTSSGFEVDLLVGKKIAIEIKATTQVQSKHLKGLLAISEELKFQKRIVVSLDPVERTTFDGILVWPYELFLKRLWEGDLF
jgi:uncharacterized protein